VAGTVLRNARVPRALFPSPRPYGEKVPEGRMRGVGESGANSPGPSPQPSPREERGEGVDGGDFALVDIVIGDGVIQAIQPAGSASPDAPAGADVIDLDNGVVLPAFVECHTHLDKGHIWPRTPNPDGTFPGALESVGRDRDASWSAADVRARMDFGLRSAVHHGVGAIRTHIDSVGKQIGISWPVFAELRDQWRDRITLQASPLFGIQWALDADHMKAVVAAVRAHGTGLLGCVTYMIPELDQALDIMFRTAMENGWDLDFHVDESSDPAARSLERIALAALRHRFTGRILCGHCCSLALLGPEDEARVIARVKEAGIAVVSLPMCNMYLQDRQSGRTPRWRGVTSLHELKAAGVPVMVSSDNTRDPFYAYGDLDTLEVFREATRILHLDHPAGGWISAITSAPARVMGLQPDIGRIAAGPANLVLFKARNWTELLSRPQSDRIVIRHGQRLATTPPDYRELDGLAGMSP
jgi:cytosine/creatinine deaminase